MTTKSFHDLVSESNSIPWDRNWGADRQPGDFTAQQYSEIARRLRIPALLKVKKFLELNPNGVLKDDMGESARFYTLEATVYHGIATTSIDDLIEELTLNESNLKKKAHYTLELDAAMARGDHFDVMRIVNDAKPYIETAPDNRFLKSPERIKTKLKEYEVKLVQHPERIGDYLRFQTLFDNAHDLAQARHTQQYGEVLHLTSQKDKLRRPDTIGGHRSFMSRAEISDDKDLLHFEMMATLFQSETYMIDKSLRSCERDSHEMGKELAATQPGLSGTYFAASQTLEQLRKIAFFQLYEGIENMNDMLDPDIDARSFCLTRDAIKEFQETSAYYILGKLPTVKKIFPELVTHHTHH